MNTKQAVIVAEKASNRIDNFLSEHFDQSRSYFASLVDEGHVRVNGKTPKKSASVNIGDEIVVCFPPEAVPDITPRPISFDIVYNTARYAIINKPAGLTVHPAPGHYDDSLVNGLLYTFSIEDEGFRPGIVHRLDKDTSGLLLVAKDRDARERLSGLFQSREIDKYYLAIASGKASFKNTVVEAPIARDKVHRKRMTVSAEGRAAKSEITVLEQYQNAFLAEVKLFTGRTHQIRVHMKHLGYPLLGDSLYAGKGAASAFARQALHAHRLEFIDPFTSESVKVQADLPEDMAELLEKLKSVGA